MGDYNKDSDFDDYMDLDEVLYSDFDDDDAQSEEYGDYESFENGFGAAFDDKYNYDDRYLQLDDGSNYFDDGNQDEGYYHQFHYEVIKNENQNDDNDEASVPSVPAVTEINWYWMFELVFMAAVGGAIVVMFVSVQKDEWMQSLKTLNEQRVNRRKYGFNRINVVFDTTADDSGSDAQSEDDRVQEHKLMYQSSDSGDEHLGSNPSVSQESQ